MSKVDRINEKMDWFLEKLKETSSNLNNMSATVENPNIPLVQRNGQPNYTSGDPGVDPEQADSGGHGKKKGAKKKWSK